MLHRRPICVFLGLVLTLAGVLGSSARAQNPKVRTLRGTIQQDTTLKARRTNVIDGIVVVASGVTLRVQAGTTVLAGSGSALVVERGGRLIAIGSPDLPIVFTSAQPEAERRRGDWGGIVLNGSAPVDAPGHSVEPTDGSGSFGGERADDSSGQLSCVRVEYGGFPVFGPERPAAISFRGAGNATIVDRIEAMNADGNGIEIAGGTVKATRLVAVGCNGSGLRTSLGWSGSTQFVLTLVRGDLPAHSNAAIVARSCSATIANATIVGGGSGLRLEGGACRVANVLALACSGAGVLTGDATTTEAVSRGDIRISGVLLEGNDHGANVNAEVRQALLASGSILVESAPGLANARDESVPDFRPVSDAVAVSSVFATAALVVPDAAPYAGAFGLAEDEPWTAGWASFRIPPIPRYLAHSAPSAEALSRDFLDALAAENVPALKRVRITKDEFTWYVWPELPASQLPNVTSEFAWSQATLNSLSGLGGLLSQYAGKRFELVSIRFAGGTKAYPSYRVHSDSRLTVRDEAGQEFEVKLFGSMLEMNGRYKLFSHVID